tara:strand:+ start:177 stop:1343 length:1167 start_codon:yes stop_codon:yes gene_type:complete
MSALLDGFRTGYQVENQRQQQQESKRRYEESMGLQRQRMAMQQESHKANMDNSALNRQLLQSQVEDLPASTEHRSALRDIEMETAKQNQTVSGIKLDEAKHGQSERERAEKRTRAEQKLKAAWASRRFDSIYGDPDFEGTDFELLFSGTGRKAAIKLTDGIKNQDWPTVVESFNTLYKPKLNKMVGKEKGRDGGEILDVEAVDFVIADSGAVRVPVQVTTSKGRYNSYLSELRTSDPNDAPKELLVDELLGKGAQLGAMATIMESSGVNAAIGANVDRYYNPQGGKSIGIPAKVQEMEYTRRLLGDEQYKQWLMYGRGKSPQELSMAAYKLAVDTLDGVYFDSPEEKRQAVEKMTSELTSKFNQPSQSGKSDPPNPPRDLGDDPLGIR